jgi:aspartyl-tRNA(Asn)/glutamyl-tRNA(Gln) amidotransferase subunit A
MDPTKLSLTETQKLLQAKKTSAKELTESYLARIKKIDPKIQSYLHINENSNSNVQNPKSKIQSIPLAHKDVFCTEGMPTTAGSKILADYIPPFDATAIAKLKTAGAINLGKLNTDEFTMGSSTETSAYKQTKNPWDLTRVPGGSSGGSAAAVAADLCVAATGTDTGGSIRQPASFCGCVGLKPTYGRISRFGVISMASSLDTIGVLTKTVADAAILLQELAGVDKYDATSGQKDVPDYFAKLPSEITPKILKGLKIGVPKEYFIKGLDPKVEKIIQTSIEKLQTLGAEIKNISLPHTEFALPTYYLIASSEISANMARFDGMRFGPTTKKAKDLIETYFINRSQGFGDEVKRRIILGTFALSEGYADQFYKKALQVRTLIAQDFEKAFAEVDLLITPVAPTTAFKINEKTEPLEMYLSDIFTIPASLAGIPGISVPAGFADNLPVGLQLLGPQFAEIKLLKTGHVFQMTTDFHLKKPDLS